MINTFLVACAQFVVSTLGSINDVSSAMLMRYIHERQRRGHIIDVVLARAMRRRREEMPMGRFPRSLVAHRLVGSGSR